MHINDEYLGFRVGMQLQEIRVKRDYDLPRVGGLLGDSSVA